ncbi:MAG: hypothetical protein R3293_12150 [Candidatus Promineifilaceae bacterium]|nr:hypothetical protein [Candidatus Promineifilaceae bacterium]
MINSLDLAAVSHFGIDRKSPMEARRKGGLLFSRALTKGFWRKFRSRFTGKETELKHFGQLAGHSQDHTADSAGVQLVALDQIVGSENRTTDFDNMFYPLRAHLQDRWAGIAAARRLGIVLPPVELIQVGQEYYVRDGHHRISVARALGQESIEAVIVH